MLEIAIREFDDFIAVVRQYKNCYSGDNRWVTVLTSYNVIFSYGPADEEQIAAIKEIIDIIEYKVMEVLE